MSKFIENPLRPKSIVDKSQKMNEVMKKIEKYDPLSHSVYRGHTGAVWSIISTVDNSYIFSGSDDQSIIIWKESDFSIFSRLQGHTNAVNALALTKNDEFLISGSWDNSIKLWDWKTSQEIFTLEGHTGGVYCFAMTKDLKMLISGAGDGTARIWNMETLMQVGMLDCLNNSVFGLALTSDEKFIFTAGWDGAIRIWEFDSHNLVTTIPGEGGIIQCLVVTPNMKHIAFGTRSNLVKIWDFKSKKQVMEIKSHNNWVRNLVVTKDSKYVITCSADKTMRIINLTSLKEEFNLEGHEGYIFGLFITRDGRFLLSGASDKTVRKWEIGCKKRHIELEGHSESVICINGFLNKFLITGSSDKTIKVWDVENSKIITTFEGHNEKIWAVVVSKDLKYLVSCSEDKKIIVWNLETHAQVSVLNGHTDFIFALDLSEDNTTIVSSGREKFIFVWDFFDARVLCQLEGHTDTVFTIKIFKNSTKAISGSADYTIRIWDIVNFKQERVIKTGCGMIECVKFDQIFKILAIADRKNVVTLWDLKKNEKIDVLKGHSNWVKSIAFNHGSLMASCSNDGTVVVWDFKQKVKKMVLKGHGSGVRGIFFLSDSKLASVSDDKTVRVWDFGQIGDLEVTDYESSLDSFIFLTKIKNKEKPNKGDRDLKLGSLSVNLAHIYCYLDLDDLLTKALVRGTEICKDSEGNSPLFYALNRTSQKCVDVLLEYLTKLTDQSKFKKFCKVIKSDFFALLKFPCQSLHNFLNTILFTSKDPDLPKFGHPIHSLPMINFTNTSKIHIDCYLSKKNSYKLQQISFKMLPFKICLEIGSVSSFKFLKIICFGGNPEIFKNSFVEMVVLDKWRKVKKYFIAYSMVQWINLLVLIFMIVKKARGDSVFVYCFLTLNSLLGLFEVLKIYSLTLVSYLKLTNDFEIFRIFTCLLWVLLDKFEKDTYFITFFMIIINFISGISCFRAFDHTRSYVPLILSTVKGSFLFLVLYIYSILAFILLFQVAPESNMLILNSPYEIKQIHASTFELIYFFIYSLTITVIMLNILIIVIGDSFNKYVFSNSENCNVAMASMIFEIESVLFWKRKYNTEKYLQICEQNSRGRDEWKGKTRAVNTVIKAFSNENMQNFDEIQQKVKGLERLKNDGDRILEKLEKLVPENK